ncbi:MPT63 family protein [Rhodococcus erythropolis]|uniref:MPT63 family protein n=1 Tax=Rhodococcus erythropolis TaxID=1833 RepID=UPI0021BECB39|nr:DUF1942 domain-containing protein [Rhodococcus erythropolis]
MKSARNLVAATAAAVCMGAIGAPAAAAEDSVVHTLGGSAELVNGNVVQAWTITDLKPSSDTIPYVPAGTLWEATATDTAVRGTVQPIVSNLNARASRSGQTYRVLFGVATPQGVNPSALSQGEQVTGTVYFDVTGDAPDAVFYSAGGPDLAVWVQPPPAPPRSSVGSGSSYSAPSAAGGAEAAAAEAAPASAAMEPGAAPAVEGEGVAVIPGSAGTPVVPGSEDAAVEPSVSAGTPVDPSVSAGTPVPPADVAATAPGGGLVPAAVQHVPAAAGSSGTPVTPGPAETVLPPVVVAPSAAVLPPA